MRRLSKSIFCPDLKMSSGAVRDAAMYIVGADGNT
jgi:hypothetical protein